MTPFKTVTASIAFAIAAVLANISVPTTALAQWVTVGSPTGKPTYCYGNCGGRVQQPNVRMPWTQQNVRGRQMVIMPQQHHRYAHHQQTRYQTYRAGGYAARGVATTHRPGYTEAQPGPKYQQFVRDHCGPGTTMSREAGGVHCRTPSSVTVREVWD
jgi:hypothetical protein